MWALVLGALGCTAIETLKATTCPSYSCGTSNSFSEGQCIAASQTEGEYLIQGCSDNTTCSPTTGFTNAYCQATPIPIGCPGCSNGGDFCSTDADCTGNLNCTGNFCQGASLNQTCDNDAYCNLGLFCDLTNSTCQSVYQVNQTGCLSDFHCTNNAGCNTTAGLPGNCVAYMSVPNGGLVQYCDCTSGFSLLCANLTCSCSSPYTSTQGVCISPFINPELASPCTLGTPCTGTNAEGNTTKSSCVCGNNVYGNAYCTPMTGDAPTTEYFSLLKSYYSSSKISGCNTKSRATEECLVYTLGTNATGYLLMNDFYWQNYPILQQNDACVQEVYNEYYWVLYYEYNPTPDTDDDDDFGVAGFALATTLLAFT